MAKIIWGPVDLRHLDWTERRTSSGASGTLLKARSGEGEACVYWKMASVHAYRGPEGLEPVTELVVSRLLDILGVPHVQYDLVDALVLEGNEERRAWVSRSPNFRRAGERKMQLDNFFQLYQEPGESPYELCQRMGWGPQIDAMLVVDYLILNRDRHGANIEVLIGKDDGAYRLAPLFDHGLALLARTPDDPGEIRDFDPQRDRPVNNFIGSRSLWENLSLIQAWPELKPLRESNKGQLLEGLDGIVSKDYQEKTWEIIWRRWMALENLRDPG